ncbi:MAG TPA: glucoamylase family protein, partial [Albitalea sp.]|nr:glucoamylase family protein [Albitalea sp.]
PALTPLFDDLEQRSFNYFWDTANPQNGLVPDRYPNPPFASIAAVGFGLTAIPVGVERGYITRAQARDRVLATLRFFAQAPQGPGATGVSGYKGFFYHFLDMQSGARYADTELSTVDTSLLLGGMLFAQSYFDQADAGEAEIRSLVDLIYGRVDWQWAQVRSPLVSMGWTPERGFIAYDWRGYDEGMIVYVLALGSPTHAVDPAAWTAWTATYADTYGSTQGQEHLGFAPLFGHQYSHVWIDFRGIQDAYMRDHALDYFENSRRATLAQRSYAIANVAQWKDYGENVWGLTACDGPGDLLAPDYSGRQRSFYGYTARGAGLRNTRDDGTIAPTAAASSLPFAPEIVIPAVEEMNRRFGATIYASYGFLDAFNTSFTATNMTLGGGQVVPGFGWVDTQYVGIDQGPIVAMIENYRSDLIWKTTRKNAALRRGLERAGFSGGWLSAN